MTDPRLQDKQWRTAHLYKIRNKNKELVRFQRNRAQRHFNEHKWYRNIILKSRQLGFTTDEAIDELDDTLFTRNFDALLIAHNLDAAKKIFSDKIELAWNNLHPDLQRLYRVDTNTAQTLKFDFGDKTFSSIAVDTTGRSGTFHRVHVTEFADICKKYPEKAREIIEGTVPAVPMDGRIDFESTAQGAGGAFYEMFMEAWGRGEPTRPVEYKAHFYNWQYDDEQLARTIAEPVPQEFRDYQKEYTLSDIEITYYYHKFLSLNQKWNALKREYPTTPEEAFEAIIEGVIFQEELTLAKRGGRIGKVPYNPALPVFTVWDFGKGVKLAVGFFQRTPVGLFMIDGEEGKLGDAMPQMIARVKAKPYVYGKHFPPHDAYDGEIGTGKSRVETAKDLGFTFEGSKDYHAIPDVSVSDGIDRARTVWPRLYIDEQNCDKALKALRVYQYEWDEKRGMYKDNPFHNWASHWGDVLRYASLVEDKMIDQKPKPYVPRLERPLTEFETGVDPLTLRRRQSRRVPEDDPVSEFEGGGQRPWGFDDSLGL